MIPKTIHYCWFGRNPLPDSALKCIASWRKFLPDYEIKEWNEDNFDVACNDYVREAYAQKKYAFVSDYARFWILYHEGGLYFDTDVEVIRPMEHIIEAGPFMGFEKVSDTLKSSSGNNGHSTLVAPGLGLGVTPGFGLYKELLDHYDSIHYCDAEGRPYPGTIVKHTTEILKRHGLQPVEKKQTVAGVTIYPSEVFCPMDSTTGILRITPQTVSIHHYTCSWMDRKSLRFRLHLLKNTLIRIFGERLIMRIARLFSR